MENTEKKKSKKKTSDKKPVPPVKKIKPTSLKLKLRNTRSSDYQSIKEIMDMVYSNAGGVFHGDVRGLKCLIGLMCLRGLTVLKNT